MRVVTNLKVSDFTDGYDPKTGITTLHLIRHKMNYELYTFLSPEASNAVHDYLDWRNRTTKNECDKKENQLEKQHVTTNTGYLFITRNVPDEYLKLKKEKEKEELRKLTDKAIIVLYQRLNEEAQKSSTHGEYNLIRSHNMRRFFNTTLLAEHASIFFVDFLLGHKLDATHEAYYRAGPKSLKEEYRKYIPFITIEKALDPSDHPDFIRLKKESETYARAAANSAVERQELIELRAQLQKMQEFEQVFKAEIARMKEQFENPQTPVEKFYMEHKKKMAFDPKYKAEYERCVSDEP